LKAKIQSKIFELKMLEPNSFSELNLVSIMVTKKCNMSCSYCPEDTSQDDLVQWNVNIFHKLLKWLYIQNDDTFVALEFFGGEPLLKWKLIKDILNKSREELSKYKISNGTTNKFGISFCTNITLINRDMLDWLKSWSDDTGIRVGFSLSFDTFSSDSNRLLKRSRDGDNKSPVMLISLIMKMLAEEYNVFMRNSTIRISLTPEHLETLEEDMIKMFEYDPDCISLYPVLSIDPDMEKWNDNMFSELTNIVNNVSRLAILNTRTNIQTLEYVNKKGFGCGAGVTSVYVNAKGSVYGCFYTAQEELDYDLLANFIDVKTFPNKHITTGVKIEDPKCSSCNREHCLMCYANNMNVKGERFCSAAWCQEGVDFYEETLPLCDLSVLNSKIATLEDGNTDILNSINSELYDISGYIQAIMENNRLYELPLVEVERVSDNRVNWMNTLSDLDLIKDSLKILMLNNGLINRKVLNNE